MSSNYQKTDNSVQKFEKEIVPQIGCIYHLSWAYKAAKFTLTEILDNVYGTVWTGATNDKYIKIKLKDLRHIRNKKT